MGWYPIWHDLSRKVLVYTVQFLYNLSVADDRITSG